MGHQYYILKYLVGYETVKSYIKYICITFYHTWKYCTDGPMMVGNDQNMWLLVKKKGSHVWWIVNNWFLKIPQTKGCTLLTFWHWSFTFNSNKSPTWCNNFSVYYPDVCLQLNMFRAFFRPSSWAQWLQWQPLVLPSYRGDSRAVFVVAPTGRPDHEHSTTVTTIRR